ncbi:RecQ family ATP-dependent DNA helicase [Aquimarina sp. ERC-38]|uniref:RecQ family ATP-dependent DNA helicase n=1 Tax=Aquimarina sp. ERC-38 TaxID=2949996 RepID=UPI0022482B1D|nr:ATP-dependent DNA helicase RecQ [Aquimarina sp. ERC-38]UZO80178.1 RecQ family ATP-dependent DNA helicase [Aquimarina sp. ERC-38]
MNPASEVLHTYWGHSSFKPGQEKIIANCLNNTDCIALLPTGGGKSACYQIPGLLRDGICLVISPLIALMEDQVNQLKQKGIKAVALTSTVKPDELMVFFDNCTHGSYKFLYVSPERLQNEVVLQYLQQLPLNLIAVDEAHCISEWGHDFRPDYRKIKVLRELVPSVPIIALSATATSKVIKEIKENLDLFQPEVIKVSFARKNLAYKVFKVEDKMASVVHVLNKYPGSSIIYVRNRKATLEITTWLNNQHFKATSYHGGIDTSEKSKRLTQWMSGEVTIMVATNAFGMGIDKPDVRNVIHIALPDSIENYFQEAGRAGRDGVSSNSFLFYQQNDIQVVKNQYIKTLPDKDFLSTVYHRLVTYLQIAYGEGMATKYIFNFNLFCQQYDLPILLTYNCLQFLDQSGILKFTKRFQRNSSLYIKASGNELLQYIENNKEYQLVIKAILRLYGGVFEESTAINMALIATKIGKDISFIVKVLQAVQDTGMLTFIHKITDAEVVFLVPREDQVSLSPLTPLLKTYRDSKINKVDAIIRYIESQQCRNIQLLQYFDEPNAIKCTICDICLQKIPEKTKPEIASEIKKLLNNKTASTQEIVASIHASEALIIEVIRELLEKNYIKRNISNTYQHVSK